MYRIKDYFLPVGIFFFWICYLIYYPNFYAFIDEQIYLEKAYQLSQGVFSQGETSESLDVNIDERYPPGQSILIAILLNFGYKYIFLLNPFLLTLTTLILARMMMHYSIPDYFALLVLFHPTMFILSRTIMSDIPAAFFFLLSVWILFFRKKAHFVGAAALGFCISLRVAMIPFSGLCIVYALFQQRNNLRHVLQILAGFFLGIIPFLIYIYQANIFSSTVYGNEMPSMGNVIPHAAAYFISLNLIYPLMFILGIFPRYKNGWLLKSICVMAFVFFPFFLLTRFSNLSIELVLNQRYLIFVIGLLLIGYSQFLSKKIITNEIRFSFVFLSLVVGAFVISSMHQAYLNQNYTFHKVIYKHTTEGSLIIVDDRSYELIQSVFGDRKIINTELVQSNEQVFRQIELFLPGEVYLINLDRRDGERLTDPGFEDKLISINIHRKLSDAILEQFQYEKVADYEQNWLLVIYKISS